MATVRAHQHGAAKTAKATKPWASDGASVRAYPGALIDSFCASFMLADLCLWVQGHDSDALAETIKAPGNRKTPGDCDKNIYKARNLAEQMTKN